MLEGIIKVYQCCKPEHSYLIDLCKKLEKNDKHLRKRHSLFKYKYHSLLTHPFQSGSNQD